jgi:flagellar assembly factor FliW
MKFVNQLIGEIEVSNEKVIDFPQGIIGFENHKKFAIVNNSSYKPFCWLISMDQDDFAIPVVNPFLLIREYNKKFPRELIEELKENVSNYEVLCVVNPKGNNGSVTLNLKGPILIDYLKQEGRQIILTAEILSVSYPLN